MSDSWPDGPDWEKLAFGLTNASDETPTIAKWDVSNVFKSDYEATKMCYFLGLAGNKACEKAFNYCKIHGNSVTVEYCLKAEKEVNHPTSNPMEKKYA